MRGMETFAFRLAIAIQESEQGNDTASDESRVETLAKGILDIETEVDEIDVILLELALQEDEERDT